MKKTLLSALLLSGISLFASEPLKINLDKGNEFLKENSGLTYRKAAPEKNVLKLKQTRFSASGKEWDEATITGKGLFINFGLFFPPNNYLDPYYEDGDGDEYTYNLGFNFEVGSYFRIAKISDGKFGIGLRATWLSLGYCSFKVDKDIYRAAEISIARIGPQFGFAINEKMGVDAFYQFGFNLTDEFASIDTGNEKKLGVSSAYMGLSHEVGAAFRYQVYTLGFGYRFGKVKNFLNVYDGETLDEEYLDDKKSPVNSFRVFLGFKF